MLLSSLLASLLAIKQTHASHTQRDVAPPGPLYRTLPVINMINNDRDNTKATITCQDLSLDKIVFLRPDAPYYSDRPVSSVPVPYDPEEISFPLGKVNSTTSVVVPGYVSSCRA